MNKQDYLKQYERRLRNLDDPDETGLDEQLVLLTRDEIADLQWSQQELATIDRLDDRLIEHWRQFEDLLPLYAFQDRSRWWWFVHEGPEARERARAMQLQKEHA